MKLRFILLTVALSGAAEAGVPAINMARQHHQSLLLPIALALVGAAIASTIVLATMHNLPLMLRLAAYARWFVAVAVVVLVAGAVLGKVFGLH